MKKVIYDYMTEDRMKKLMKISSGEKTEPIKMRSHTHDMWGNPYKMYKITTIVEEVPQSEVKNYFDNTDLENKYTIDQINAGTKLYYENPEKTTREDNYTYYTDTLNWHELGAKRKEEYILKCMGSTYTAEDDDWP